MPSHLVSPPAVQRVVPLSKPVGSPLAHVSVSAVHGMSAKAPVVETKPVLAATKAPVSAPTHMVSQAKTY